MLRFKARGSDFDALFLLANVFMLIPFLSFISFCSSLQLVPTIHRFPPLKPLISNIYRVSVYNLSNRCKRTKYPNFVSMWSSICVKIDSKCLSVNDDVDDYNDSDSTIGSCLIRTLFHTANQITSSFVHAHTHSNHNSCRFLFISFFVSCVRSVLHVIHAICSKKLILVDDVAKEDSMMCLRMSAKH